MAFKTERELFEVAVSSEFFQELMNPPSKQVFRFDELKGLFGIPDIVIAHVTESDDDWQGLDAFAFEMKLSNWQRALMQAYRYRTFANQVYVVIDATRARPAIANLERFQRSNVGLVSIDVEGVVVVHHEPEFRDPYCSQIGNRFQAKVQTAWISAQNEA